MNPSARLQGTFELLTLIDTTPRPADAIMSSYFRSRRYIGSKDRSAIASLTYDIMRHHARLNWWLMKYNQENAPRLRLLIHLRLMEGMTVKAIEDLCNGRKFSPDPPTEEERTLMKRFEGHTLVHPSMPDTVIGECPDWAAESLKARFGKNFAKEMEALLRPAPLDLRINPLKTTRERAFETLRKHNLQVSLCPCSPFGIRVHDRPSLNQIALLKDGVVEIQDEGSQLVALLMDAKPGQRVMDFCAGAGGKTLAIAAQMENKGRVTACDIMEKRLKKSTERFRRAGLHNIETKVLTSERDPWVKKHKGMFDSVLVDAPCSGTGTWRRNPDTRWHSLAPKLDVLLPLQASILDSAARLVKTGGRLVYATCSLLSEENETQVEAFLETHPDFALVPVQEATKGIMTLPNTGKYLSLTPAAHQMDGFFAAVMERHK